MKPAAQSGQLNGVASPLSGKAERSLAASAEVSLPSEQNCPPMPLSANPSICPWPKPQENTLNSTLKYKAQAMKARRVGGGSCTGSVALEVGGYRLPFWPGNPHKAL